MREILRILLGNICITSAYAFITVPHHVVNGGVTSFSMIMHNFIPVDISLITNTVTIALLGISCYFLGKSFLMKSLLSSICYMVFFSYFHAFQYCLPLPELLAVFLAAVMVGIGYYLCISAGSSTVGFDVLALILHKYDARMNIALTMRCINIVVILLGFASYGLISICIGIAFTLVQTQLLQILLKKQDARLIQKENHEKTSVSKCIAES